jgi:hypothetical protein
MSDIPDSLFETEQPKTALAVKEKAPILAGDKGLILNTFDAMWRYATLVASSGLAPQTFENNPSKIMVAFQYGAEIGLTPMTSLNYIAVINGRPSLWGEVLVARAFNLGLMADIGYAWEFDGKHLSECEIPTEKDKMEDSLTCIVSTKRKGSETYKQSRYSVGDARQAGLWTSSKQPWIKTPKRMLQARARGNNMKDYYPEIFGPFALAEDMIEVEAVQVDQPDRTQQFSEHLSQHPLGSES